MKVFQVIFENKNKTLVFQYVGADNIKAVSDAMKKHAEEMDWDLKAIRYALTVTQTIPKVYHANRIFECDKKIRNLKAVLKDWLECADIPEEWMRCRNNAKAALENE